MSSELDNSKLNKVSNINFEDLIPFCIFPNSFIRNGKIPAIQRMLFEILCSYDFLDTKGNRKGWCDPGLESLSEELGLGIRATQIHLKRLVESGMICVIYRNCCKSGKRTSIYVLNILPGLSIEDIKKIATTRNLDIKNTISGLNTIQIQTVNGMEYISREEFDLQLIVTGHRSDTIIEGEIAKPEDIISDEEEFKETGIPVKPKVEDNEETGDEISFGKPKKPINLNARKEKLAKMNSENWNHKDVVTRISCGNYNEVKPIDYCRYFKYQFEVVYEGECLIVDKFKDVSTVKTKLQEMEPDDLISIMDYFIKNYQKLFYNEEYKRPQLRQLSIPWIMNKVLENFYYAKKGEEEFGSIPVQTSKDDIPKQTVTQLF